MISSSEKKILKQKSFLIQKNKAYLYFAEGGSCTLEKLPDGKWLVKVVFIYEDIQESQYETNDLKSTFALLGLN